MAERGPRLESRIQDFITTELRHHNRRTEDLAVGRTAMSSSAQYSTKKLLHSHDILIPPNCAWSMI